MVPVVTAAVKTAPWWAPYLAAAGSAAASWVGTKLAGDQMKARDRRQNRANIQMQNLAFQQNKEMVNLQNQYNSPLAQMQRFKDAGLNPNLIYGQGTPGNQSQIAQYQAPRMESNVRPHVDPMSMLMNYMNLNQQSATLQQSKEQVELTRVQQAIGTATEQNLISQTALREIEMEWLPALNQASIDKNEADVQYLTARIALTALEGLISKEELKMARVKSDMANRGVFSTDELVRRNLVLAASKGMDRFTDQEQKYLSELMLSIGMYALPIGAGAAAARGIFATRTAAANARRTVAAGRAASAPGATIGQRFKGWWEKRKLKSAVQTRNQKRWTLIRGRGVQR
jgi:hypothetical protein